MIKLLPVDLYSLWEKWTENISIQDGGQTSEIERSVAMWLAEGLIDFQDSENKIGSFSPISHLIGTDRFSLHYTDSLVELLESLNQAEKSDLSNIPFSIGEIYSGGVAVAGEVIADKFGTGEYKKEHCFWALKDSLSLIQGIKPYNGESSIYRTWLKLNDRNKVKQFRELRKANPYVIEHAFTLACYSYCAPESEMMKQIIGDIENGVKKGSPKILKTDIQACKDSFCLV